MKGYNNNLKRELKKIWDMPVQVIFVVVGALRTTPKKLKQQLSDIRTETKNCHITFCKDPLKCS